MKKKVLIVNQNNDILYLNNILNSAGYEVLTAKKDIDSTFKIPMIEPDVILYDMQMKDVHSPQVPEKFNTVPIIGISNQNHNLPLNKKLIKLLTKPVKPLDIISAIEFCNISK